MRLAWAVHCFNDTFLHQTSYPHPCKALIPLQGFINCHAAPILSDLPLFWGNLCEGFEKAFLVWEFVPWIEGWILYCSIWSTEKGQFWAFTTLPHQPTWAHVNPNHPDHSSSALLSPPKHKTFVYLWAKFWGTLSCQKKRGKQSSQP